MEDDGAVLPEDFGDAAPLASAQCGDEQEEQNSARERPGENLHGETLVSAAGEGRDEGMLRALPPAPHHETPSDLSLKMQRVQEGVNCVLFQRTSSQPGHLLLEQNL